MAIYYLNPYTQTNGTGTFASPWSPSSTTRTGLVSGDEVRILGNTVPLFLPTVYTAYKGSETTMVISAGGGLGADWAIGNYGYIVEDDVFFYVGGLTANTLTVGSGTSMPWSNSVLSTTNTKTILKYDTANNGTSTSSGTVYVLGASTSLANVVVSDAWTNATTRVTDGSVKSVFRGAGTFNSIQGYLDTSSSSPTLMANNTLNMQNSYFVPNPYTSGGASIYLRGRDSVANVAQITMYTSSTSVINLGASTYPAINTTFTVKTTNCYYIPVNTLYAANSTINITNLYSFIFDYFFGGPGIPQPQSSNNTINLTNYVYAIQTGIGGWIAFPGANAPKITINFSGIIDWIAAATPSYALAGGGGDVSLNILPGTTIYKGRRATTGATSLTGRYIGSSSALIPPGYKLQIYTANLLPTITATANVSVTPSALISAGSSFTSYYGYELKKPLVVNLEYPGSTATANNYHVTAPINILQTYRDGSWGPIEILGIDTKVGYQSTAAVATSFPNVFRDTVTVRTTGPSLRSFLSTRTAAYWQPSANVANQSDYKSSSYKNIKIPIVSGSNYTITGYIRSNYASSTTGDVVMSVIYNNAVLATQNMTSAMYNSWEQFTLSFTASATGEAYLVWEMYYPSGNMSYWLDDLSIVKA